MRPRRVVSSVHVRRGRGGRCPPVSCHLQNRFDERGPLNFGQKVVPGVGGGIAAPSVGTPRGARRGFIWVGSTDGTRLFIARELFEHVCRVALRYHGTPRRWRGALLVASSRRPPPRTVPSFSELAFSFLQIVLSPLTPAVTPRGAVGSGRVHTRMRLDFLSGGHCYEGCVQSHRVTRATPRRKGVALSVASSRTPRTAERRRFSFWFWFLFLCHRARRRRRRGEGLWARGLLKLRCDLTSHREMAVVITPASSRIRSRVPPTTVKRCAVGPVIPSRPPREARGTFSYWFYLAITGATGGYAEGCATGLDGVGTQI